MKKTVVLILLSVLACSVQARTRVACIGNSITYGLTTADPANDSYPAQLQKLLGEGYEVGNFGKSGATLLRRGHRPYMDQNEFRSALDFKADIAVIHLGINDTDPRDWPDFGDDFVRDYLALIDSLKSVNPSMRVILARMTPIRDGHHRFGSGTRQWHAEIQKAIETAAEVSGCELIDFNTPLIVHPEMFNDQVHPSKEGASLIAMAAYRGITGDYGGLGMSPLYSDGMVIQMGRPVVVTGTDDTGKAVKVSFMGEKRETAADNNGKWTVMFPMCNEARTGLVMKIEDGSRTLVYRDVCIGEVWLCSGQSNMEFKLRNATGEDISAVGDDSLRLFRMKPLWDTGINGPWSQGACDSVNRLVYFGYEGWRHCSEESAADFSAVAYHFGKTLRDSLHVPVGIICNAVGGSPQESWIDRASLEEGMPGILKDWTENDYIMQWCRQRAVTNMGGRKEGWMHHPYEPCYLFDVGIRPLGHHAIRGVVWYQGESNAHCAETYETLFTLFVRSWRGWFKNNALPFVYAQLSSMERPSWCVFRDTQRRLMDSLDHVGMAVTSDIGERWDVHPKNKKDVGERLARWALSMEYGHSCIPSGPVAESAEATENGATVRFRYSDGLATSDGKDVRGFEAAEYEGLFHEAACTIENGKAMITSDSIGKIRLIRYGWKPYTDANLVNGEGLPAGTFRIEVTE